MNIFWPAVSSKEGARKAARLGAFVLGFRAISDICNVMLITFTGEDGIGRWYSVLSVHDDAIQNVAVYGIAAISAAWFCRRLWLRHSVAAAWVGLAWQISAVLGWVWLINEVGMKAITAKGYALILPILLTLFAVHGVRGAIANKRIAAGPTLIHAEPGA
jgi:hypothetical protein